MKKTDLMHEMISRWPRWERSDEIPALSEMYEEEGRAIYKSDTFLLAMVDGSFETGAFVVILDDNGGPEKCGWHASQNRLLKMRDILAWGPLPKHPAEEEDKDD